MATVDDYLAIITSQHADKPKFIAMVTAFAQLFVYLQSLDDSLIPLFDLDVAVGSQLDAIGAWAGISRNVTIPLPDVYFSWDDTDQTGWDLGIWQGDNPGTINVLPDDVYRTFIRAKIAANQWDGTIEGAYAIWDSVFPDLTILIQDNQNMTYDLGLVGTMIDSLTLALITGGYLPLRPGGVQVNAYFIPSGSGPLFGWDIENNGIAGWDEGSWASIINPS